MPSRISIADKFIEMALKESTGDWELLFKQQLKLWGFNRVAQDSLFRWGRNGHNWDKLHQGKEEEGYTSDEWLKLFFDEVHYCSDRMNLDRLFRCHWLYNQYRMSATCEKEVV